MAARLRLLLPMVLVAYFSCMMVEEASANWWSLGISSCATKSFGACENCASLQNMDYLNNNQQELCNDDAGPVRAIAKGARRAIIECQRRFRDNVWNCSTFNGNNLFGAFVTENHTRETAVLYGFLTAGAVQAVAEACHEQRITDCPCVQDPPYFDDEGNYILSLCSDNVEYAKNYVDQFVLPQNVLDSDVGGVTDKHNIENGGRQISDTNLTLFCTCHGLSGSCSAQTCYKKAVEISEVGEEMYTKYGGAVQVILDDSGELVAKPIPGAGNTDPPKPDNLVYVDASPNFCNSIPAMGILGTAHRQCNPDPDSSNSCTNLCCNRGHYTRTIEKPITECEFVYCCEIVCRQTGIETITEHFCKP